MYGHNVLNAHTIASNSRYDVQESFQAGTSYTDKYPFSFLSTSSCVWNSVDPTGYALSSQYTEFSNPGACNANIDGDHML